MNLLKLVMSLALAVVIGSGSFGLVLAEDIGDPVIRVEPSAKFQNPLGAGLNDVGDILIRIIRWFIGISLILVLGALVWGGIYYITSIGIEQRVGTAKKIIIWAIVGLMMIMVAFILVESTVRIIGGTTGVSLTAPAPPPAPGP